MLLQLKGQDAGTDRACYHEVPTTCTRGQNSTPRGDLELRRSSGLRSLVSTRQLHTNFPKDTKLRTICPRHRTSVFLQIKVQPSGHLLLKCASDFLQAWNNSVGIGKWHGATFFNIVLFFLSDEWLISFPGCLFRVTETTTLEKVNSTITQYITVAIISGCLRIQ